MHAHIGSYLLEMGQSRVQVHISDRLVHVHLAERSVEDLQFTVDLLIGNILAATQVENVEHHRNDVHGLNRTDRGILYVLTDGSRQ